VIGEVLRIEVEWNPKKQYVKATPGEPTSGLT
jgi:hypothetical protein